MKVKNIYNLENLSWYFLILGVVSIFFANNQLENTFIILGMICHVGFRVIKAIKDK